MVSESELAFSGRRAKQSVWVLIQKYNSVLKELRQQTRWAALFHCKDCDSFEDCLHENDVIPTRRERALVRQQLAKTKHAKLLLKTDQPAAYMVCYRSIWTAEHHAWRAAGPAVFHCLAIRTL